MTICVINVFADDHNLLEGIMYKGEMQSSTSFGDNTPLWLNANKYGLSSLDKSNGYLRASLSRPEMIDQDRKWGISYGLDMAVAYNYTSSFIVQQAFGEVRWLKGTLTVGAKEYPLELKNQQLSSGSQTLGINSRPVPQVRLALPDYWTIPALGYLVSLKGHIAYGMLTDGRWQHSFVGDNGKWADKTLYHSKAGYLRIGDPDRYPLYFEAGIETACLFGGTLHNVTTNKTTRSSLSAPKDLKSFWSALVFAGDDVDETDYANVAGDQLGSWVARLSYENDYYYFGLYYDHFFEDHSQVAYFDYDGYGVGEEWKVKKENKYHLYKMKDMMLGLEFRVKDATWLNNVVFEYLYTKYQSGAIYHDHTYNISDHMAGLDNYYNHYLYSGWTHWGQVMGNPLYLSPVYQDGKLYVGNNRFVAFHLGLSGNPVDELSYRVLATWQKGWGTYESPYVPKRTDVSVMAEASYNLPPTFLDGGWNIKLGVGMDSGKIYGENCGFQLTISKTGWLTGRKKYGEY